MKSSLPQGSALPKYRPGRRYDADSRTPAFATDEPHGHLDPADFDSALLALGVPID